MLAVAASGDSVGRRGGAVPSPAGGSAGPDGSQTAPASIVVQRRVEWSDTDAAGHHHFTAVLRWLEEAETLLYERLGVVSITSARMPRVHLEVDFTARLWFRDLVDVEVAVARIGTSSVTYRFEVRVGETVAARGICVAVHSGAGDSGSLPWPPEARDALAGAGPQAPELLVAGPPAGAAG